MSKRDGSSSQYPVIQIKCIVQAEYILAYIWTAIFLEAHPYNRQFISYGGYQKMHKLDFLEEWHPEEDRLNLHTSRLPFRLNTQDISSGS